MALDEYRRKRDFRRTPEPTGAVERPKGESCFTVQKHHATRLHYDFRLEIGGVLKSWAVPKGPTLDPSDKRLAMMVEDHPMEYMLFEGIIPAGNYGAGTVMVWDTGTYRALGTGNPEDGLVKGDLKFILDGKKLKGEFALVRMRSRRPGTKGNEWLLLKKKDAYARPGWDPEEQDWSVLTKRSLAQIAADEGSSAWTSSRPAASSKRRPLSQGAGTAGAQELDRRKAEAARRTLEMTRRTAATGPDPASLPGAVAAEMPRVIRPMLATLVTEPPESSDWLFEIKYDGVRAIAFLEDGRVRLQSRSLRDITAHYPDLAGIAADFRARQAVLDGEIVTLDPQGRPRFELLQQRMNTVPDQHLMQQYPVVYCVFDLLYLDGFDLRRVELERRKDALRQVFRAPAEGARAVYSDHQAGEGQALLELARQNELEGIVGKLRRSGYVERRASDWQKIKVVRERVFVIGGYTAPRRSREYFGSLILGEYNQQGELVHTGNAGSGFTRAMQKKAWEKLEPLRTEVSPFAGRPRTLEAAFWVKPVLKARVKFTEMTREGRMRAPVVLEVIGGTEDAGAAKPIPAEPVGPGSSRAAATPFSGSAATLTLDLDGHRFEFRNLNKVWFPEEGITKRDVLEYYYCIADYFLLYTKGRPVSMKRYPDGIHQPYFFQKEAGAHMPRWIPIERIGSEHGSTDFINYVICNDRATLVYLANLGCIEQNLWMSRVGSLDAPDFILFDLDPGSRTTFDQVVEAAQALRRKLDGLRVAGYPKTSGSRGMHVYVPLAPGYTYEHSRSFAEVVCTMVADEAPRLITLERSLNRRPQDRIYLDYLQNAKSKTVPPPYSLRARPGAPVSTPLLWEEVRRGLNPADFTLRSIWARLEKHGDLFAGTLGKGQRLEGALERLQRLLGGS